MDTINIKQITIGLTILIVGMLIYLIDRNPSTVYFLYSFDLPSFYGSQYEKVFGKLGFYLPSCIHTLSFSLLISGLLLYGTKSKYMLICFSVALINIIFELGQLMEPKSYFEEESAITQLSSYFRYGTFDIIDIAFIVIGSVFAYYILIKTQKVKRI